MDKPDNTFDEVSAYRPSTRQKILVRILAGVLILAAVTLVPWLYYVGQGKRAVEEISNRLVAAGHILTLEEINQLYHDPTLNPEENAAPLYEDAFLLLENSRQVTEFLERIQEALLALEPGEKLPDDIAEELAELLERNAEGLRLVRTAAAMPYVRFNLDFTDGYELMIPHVGQMRQAVRLLTLEAIQQSQNGENDTAVETLDTALAIASHLEAEPMLISQLTRIALIAIVFQVLESNIARDSLSSISIEKLDSRLRELETNSGFVTSMKAEMAFGNSIFSVPAREIFDEMLHDDDEKWLYLFHILSGRVHRDHAFYLGAVEDQLAVFDEPLEDWIAYPERDWWSEADDRGHLFSRFILMSGNSVRAEVYSIARLRILRILLAMERYRAEEGELPETLESLVPRYLEKIPVDPVYGRPFTIHEKDDWIVIESEGRIRQGPDREEGPIHGRIRKQP